MSNENHHPVMKAMFDDMAVIYSRNPLPKLPDYMLTGEAPNSDEIADLNEIGIPPCQFTGD